MNTAFHKPWYLVSTEYLYIVVHKLAPTTFILCNLLSHLDYISGYSSTKSNKNKALKLGLQAPRAEAECYNRSFGAMSTVPK